MAAIAAALISAPRAARAEDVVAYQADGDADAAAPNARVTALDDAFARAVAQALADVVDPEVRRQRKPVIDRELIGHARLWVARFTVTKEAVNDDRKQVSVSVRIDRDKLRARLAELNIATRGTAGDPGRDPGHDPGHDPGRDAGSGDTAAPPASAPAAIVALRIVAPDGVHATYGLAAEKDVPGLAALSDALRRASFAVKRAPASGPAARPDGELPLDDDAGEALAAAAQADLVALAGVTVGAPVPLRGIAADGSLITAHMRLVDRKAHKAIGQGAAVITARGSDPGVIGYAIDRALLAASADVVAQPAQSLPQAQSFTGDDTPVAEPGVVLVRLARATPWATVQAELKHLLGARGVSRATLRRVSPAGWVIGVATSDSIERVAAIVKKPPASDTSVAVKIVGDLVEATLSGAP